MLLVYSVLRPLFGFGHQLTVGALAAALHALVASDAWEPILGLVGLDPIYVGAAIRAIGGVHVAGFAIAEPLGGLLHQWLPGMCLGAEHVAGNAAFSMVAAPGAPALGRGLSAFGADVVWLALGLSLFWCWRYRNWRIALVGLLIQAQVGVHHLLEARVNLADIDASGLPFALEVALPGSGWFTSTLAAIPSDERNLLVGGTLLLLGYLGAVLLVAACSGLLRLMRLVRYKGRRGSPPASDAPLAKSHWSIGLVSLAAALVTTWSPIGALALGASNWQADAALSTVGVPHSGETSNDIQTIRGVGYNPWYAGLSPQQRADLYNRDFSDMHQHGINTIEGWFENQFDSVTLDAAAQNGIGVLMPFELNQDWDFSNPNVQESVLQHVSDYVEKYKDYPAVRMWAPGNENLHRILYAHMVSQVNDPSARARAAAFAAFLPKLVDRIHTLDPAHPVVYRDAEDLYLPWIVNGFNLAGGGDRPWLVYGANVYS
ncbi:MAG TPA: glycoside hydrolase family 2 TIM barrel-domain containing protein, partial [Chloroflexota bacterium]